MSHDVADFAAWKPIYKADAPRRNGAGMKEVAVGTQADNPKKVFMIFEGDASAVQPMLSDPDLAAKMKEAGVTSAPEVIVINT